MGSGSVGASQQNVDKAIRALNPTIVIAVGIAFGVNEKKQRIADILVSRQIMLYELSKIGAAGVISRGDKVHASPRLVNLFEGVAQTSWQGEEVRVGVVLTGEKLIDSLDYRNSLIAMESEAVGGEMEGGGVYVACQEHKVDWIVIKSICDWADGDKEKDKSKRQEKAAESAATFVSHALSAVFRRQANTAIQKRTGASLPANSVGSAPSARIVEIMEDIAGIFHQYRLMYSTYTSHILGKVPSVSQEFERSRFELDKKTVELYGKLQIYVPAEFRRLIARLRRIISCSWQPPRVVYYELFESTEIYPREPVDAAQSMLGDLIECYIDMSFEIQAGTASSASLLSKLHSRGLDGDANPIDPSSLTTVARAVILEHEFFRSDRSSALKDYARIVKSR